MDDALHAMNLFVVDIEVLELAADTRQEFEHVFHTAHFFDCLHLLEKIVEVELSLGHFLLHFFGLLDVELFLCPFDESYDIAHAEDSTCHAVWMKFFELVEFFSNADELNGLAGYSFNTQGGATSCVTIEFCQYDAVELQPFVEFLCGVYCVLAGHCVTNEIYLVRCDSLCDVGDFGHHLFVDVKSACGIEHNHVVAVVFCELEGVFSDIDCVLAVLGIDVDVQLLAEDS